MKNQTQFKHTLLYGLVTGVVIAIYQLALYIFGMANNDSLGNIAFFLLVIGLYISVKHFRDNSLGGFISFGKAFGTGVLTCVFAGVVGAFYSYFQFKYMAPYLVEELIQIAQETMLTKGLSDDQVELQSMLLEKMMTPGFLAFMHVFAMAFWGSFLALISAALLKRVQNPMNVE